MISAPLIEILCDGNSRLGYGHIRRSSTLAAQLEAEGFLVRLHGLSHDAQAFLPPPRYLDREPVVTVLDSLQDIREEVKRLKAAGRTVVTLDYFGNELPDVNICVFPHSDVRALEKIYVGFEYILIREEIRSLRDITQESDGNDVLIVVGGGDQKGQGVEASRLLGDQGCRPLLVQGPLAEGRVIESGLEVRINPPEFPRLLAECDWAVTNGGGCLFEALCLGKAAYVLPQTEMEIRIAAYVKKQGALLGVGLALLRSFEAAERSSVADAGRKLVDGRGAERISAIVRGLI